MGILGDFRGFRSAVVGFLRKFGTLRIQVRLGGARFVFVGGGSSFRHFRQFSLFSCGYADLWDFRQFSQPFLFLLAIHSLLVEIELRSVFIQPCSYFSEIWTAKRLDFGILGCGCGFGLVSGSAVP